MSHPVRIQLSRAKGFSLQDASRLRNGLPAVKVDRSTGLGNPFPVCKAQSTCMGVTKDIWVVGTWSGPGMWFRDTKEEAIELAVKAYRAWLMSPSQAATLSKAILQCRGKNVACRCRADKPCHADVLLELANHHITCEATS
jgi:hypothetical protein